MRGEHWNCEQGQSPRLPVTLVQLLQSNVCTFFAEVFWLSCRFVVLSAELDLGVSRTPTPLEANNVEMIKNVYQNVSELTNFGDLYSVTGFIHSHKLFPISHTQKN